MKPDVTVMYSGGLDSFVAWHLAKSQDRNPHAVFIDLGHPYSSKERNAIWDSDVAPAVIQMRGLYPAIADRLTNQIIPSRNLLLAVVGGMFSGEVWIAALEDEQNGKERDKSERFYQDTTDLLTYTNSFFQPGTLVRTPFATMTKSDVVRRGLGLGLTPEQLWGTVSCYHATQKKCGTCLTCYKRAAAFLLAGIPEPGYVEDPLLSDYAKEVYLGCKRAADQSDYNRFHCRRIVETARVVELLGIDLEALAHEQNIRNR